MFRARTLLFVCLLTAAAAARDIPLADPAALQSALARAEAEGAPVALFMVRSAEPSDPEVAGLLRDPGVERALGRAIPLILAADHHPSVATRFGVSRFPVVVFVDGAGREAGRIAGPADPAAFAARAAEILAGMAAGPPAGARFPREDRSPEALAAAGERLWSAGSRAEAAALFERALAALASTPSVAQAGDARTAAQAHLGLGDHLRASGRPAEAEPHYRAALAELARPESLFPVDQGAARARAALGLALSRRALGQTKEAAAELEGLLEGKAGGGPLRGPGRERGLFLLARLLTEVGEEAAARGVLEQCAREFPGSRYGERARRSLDAPGDSGPVPEPVRPASR